MDRPRILRLGLGLACVFVALSLLRFWQTRWYLFPLLYLNFSDFSHRFVYVQDGWYLVLLVVVIVALFFASRAREAAHVLMAVATTMKLSPLYYARNVLRMKRSTAVVFVGILLAGLVLPYFVWENYLYIYRFHAVAKADWSSTIGSAVVVVPFTLVLWYVETRRAFDWEDRVGWGLVPCAMFVGLTMTCRATC